jgi:hypothetical protein
MAGRENLLCALEMELTKDLFVGKELTKDLCVEGSQERGA